MESLQSKAFERNTEIIAAFFTNRCYNDIYSIAKAYYTKNGGQSLTNIYATALLAYLNDIEASKPGSDVVIRDTIKALHAYYCSFLGEAPLDEFIGRIIAQIIPDEFFTTMGGRERDSVLRDLVRQTAIVVVKRALQGDMLHRIIDCRADQVGVTILRDAGITVLHDFKASFISKLYAKKTSHIDAGRVIAFELYDKVRGELRKTIEMCVEAEEKYKHLSAQYTQLRDAYERLSVAYRKIDAESAQLRQGAAVLPTMAPMAPTAPKTPTQAPATFSPTPAPSASAPASRPQVEGTPADRVRETMLTIPIPDHETPKVSAQAPTAASSAAAAATDTSADDAFGSRDDDEHDVHNMHDDDADGEYDEEFDDPSAGVLELAKELARKNKVREAAAEKH